MDIKIYSTPTCPYCKLAKQYFSSKGLSYEDFDVSADKKAMEEMVKLSGQMGVPT
ncbi:MAG: NrdH-redoxin, partial [Candidatus Omnitrophica bacterium]|nr:NrdH-redoxin [Candidatus Omnitrophota bacterium]